MGFDHIDAHRTVGMVISPYTRRNVVDSTNYNQTSIVRTIELMLGLPPMNQIDASATPMASCFQDRADLTPYSVVPNNIPLDRFNPGIAAIKEARARHWAKESVALNLDDVDRRMKTHSIGFYGMRCAGGMIRIRSGPWEATTERWNPRFGQLFQRRRQL